MACFSCMGGNELLERNEVYKYNRIGGNGSLGPNEDCIFPEYSLQVSSLHIDLNNPHPYDD
ncbi:hypothetical protein [Paenibacillus wynnii]|uniref:hypothetical protein n=1 Tax=Paenibacillus wynnii TaxID=268407 RepID=UPI0012F8B66C|nr:hypothetical protein [Paenibacillus wynnii]